MATKLNTSDNYESINIKLIDYPIAFENKCKEFVKQGLAKDMEQARNLLKDCEIELELYYDIDNGLFGVESGAVESHADIVSPYSGEQCEYPKICPKCGSEHIRAFYDADVADMAHTDVSDWACADCGHTGDEYDFLYNN